MKKCKQVLAVLLALLMLMSAVSVGLIASAADTKSLYTGAGIANKMNAVDQYELDDNQYCTIILDMLDNVLKEANIASMTISLTGGLKIQVKLGSINEVISTIVGINKVKDSASSFLGDIANLNLDYFADDKVRDYETCAADSTVIECFVGFLHDSTNADLIGKLVRKGLGTGDGQLNPGSIVNRFIPDNIKTITNDIVGFLKETVFGSKDAKFDDEVATLITDTINGMDVEMLEGFEFQKSDSLYSVIDKLVRVITKWAVKNLQNDTWGIRDMILSAMPTFEQDFPFVDLNGLTQITWDWDKEAGKKYIAGTPSTYLVYHINDLIGHIVDKVIPSFNDSKDPNYTGGWTKDSSTGSIGKNGTLDKNIAKAAKFADKVLNGGTFTAEEEASLTNPTKSYAMVLADAIIKMFFPGIKVEKSDIVKGNICTLAVQALNEFFCYYIPESALDDLYTYNVDGTVLNHNKYTETYCNSLYKQMLAQALAKFTTGYFPVTFTTAESKNLDSVLKVLLKYFLNDVCKAGSTNYGALGTVSDSDTAYTAVDRIIFSVVNGSYVEGASANGGRNKSGIMPEGLLPSSYNTTEKIKNLIFQTVEDLSVGSLLGILIPNSGGDLNTPLLPNVVTYEVIRILNVLFPGTWKSKTASLDTLITNPNLADMLVSILKNISMDYHVYPGLKLGCFALGLSRTQTKGDADVSLAVSPNAGVYTDISPYITTSSKSIPSGYYIKVANTTKGINSGYHNAGGAPIQDALYKLRVNSITCENDSGVKVTLPSSAPVINDNSSDGFAISGTASDTNKTLCFLINYQMSDEGGRTYCTEQQSRVYVYLGAPASSQISSNTVRVKVADTIYASPSMLNDFYAFKSTTDATSNYTASAEDTVFPAALVSAGFNFSAEDPGSPTSTTPVPFSPFSVGNLPSSLDSYYGNYTITYKIKTKDPTNESNPDYGSNTEKAITWVMFNDSKLGSLISKYKGNDLQNKDFTNTTLWNAFQTELIKANSMMNNPGAYATTAAALATKFAEEYTALESAYKKLIASSSVNYKDSLKERLVSFVDGDETEDIRAQFTMWDYTPVSYARFSSSISTVRSYYTNNESSSIKVDEALRFNEVMSQRLYTSSLTDASKTQALNNLKDVRNKFNPSDYTADKYTPGSYADLTKAFTEADQAVSGTALSGEGAARTSDYADARSDILEALNKLTEQPLDIADLYRLVTELRNGQHLGDDITVFDNMYFTDESWEALEKALAKADVAINEPFDLLPEDYDSLTQAQKKAACTAANAVVDGYYAELQAAINGLERYTSVLLTEEKGFVSYELGKKLVVGSKVIEADDYLIVPYGTPADSGGLADKYVMSENVSRYTKDSKGNWNTYSTAGETFTMTIYKNSDCKPSDTVTTGKIMTGMAVKVDDNNPDTADKVYTIVVTGNTGERVNSTYWKKAANAMANYLPNIIANVGVNNITPAQALACDLNGDGLVDVTDLALLNKWQGGSYTPYNVL